MDELNEKIKRVFADLGIRCAYNMPSFWANGGKDYVVIPTRYAKGYQKALEDAEREITEVLSAQPERTCVNCGRTVNNGGWYADGRTRCPIEEHYALPKDGYCHLWEKRNVTDDDYPERREE